VTGARRTGARRVAAAVAGAAVALSVVGLVVASASQLTVSSSHPFLQDSARCTNATIATTGFASGGGTNWDRVRLVGVPDACAGLQIQLTVYRTRASGTTTTLATGTGTAASGTVDITTTNYASNRVTGVALLIGGWGVPTTWIPGGTVISLRSHANGNYVTAGASPLIASSTTIGTPQEFDLIINADGSVSLRAHANNMYVCAENAGGSSLIANRTAIGLWEEFDLINNPDGSISFQSLANNMYVCAEDAGASPLIANRTWILEWEEFDLIIH